MRLLRLSATPREGFYLLPPPFTSGVLACVVAGTCMCTNTAQNKEENVSRKQDLYETKTACVPVCFSDDALRGDAVGDFVSTRICACLHTHVEVCSGWTRTLQA